MKALTLAEPYASLIARGVKRIETRAWSTSYRGPLAIHAAAGFSSLRAMGYRGTAAGARDLILDDLALRRACESVGIVRPTAGQPPYVDPFTATLGKIVAVAELVDCISTPGDARLGHIGRHRLGSFELACGDYSPGRFAWALANVRQVKPLSPRDEHGKHPFAQGLWTVPESIVRKIEVV